MRLTHHDRQSHGQETVNDMTDGGVPLMEAYAGMAACTTAWMPTRPLG